MSIQSISQVYISEINKPISTLEDSPKISDDFDVLVEQLDPEQKRVLLHTIDTLQDCEKTLSQVVELAEARDYSRFSALFSSTQFEYYGLGAVQKGMLSAMQFGTLMFVRAALNETVTIDQLEPVPLFIDNAPSQQAWNQIKETFTARWGLEDKQLALFFEEMRSMPSSEKYFVCIPDTRDQRDYTKNVSMLLNIHGFNIFSTISDGKRMIPSFGMIQALLKVIESNGVTFKLVVGPSTAETIRTSMLVKSAREMCVHCPALAPAPPIADTYPSPPLDFMYHDLYHLIVTSAIPVEDRRFLGRLAAHFKPDLQTENKEIFKSYYEPLVDMELSCLPFNSPLHELQQKDRRSCIAIEFIVDAHAPAWRRVYCPSLELSNEQKALIQSLNAKVQGLFAIWKLYKRDNCIIEELIAHFEKLPHEQQMGIGKWYRGVIEQNSAHHYSAHHSKDVPVLPVSLEVKPDFTKKKAAMLSFIAEVAELGDEALNAFVARDTSDTQFFVENSHYILPLRDAGFSLEKIIKLERDELECIISHFDPYTWELIDPVDLIQSDIRFQRMVDYFLD